MGGGKIPHRIRYVKNSLGGSTANQSAHWNKIQIFDKNGVNIAPNGTITTYGQGSNENNSTGLVISAAAPAVGSFYGVGYPGKTVLIDLGDKYELSKIVMFHYWGDSRRYYKNILSISQDNIIWYTIFDSDVQGNYAETSSGKTVTW